MGDATGGSPIPLHAAIKAQTLCEGNAHLQHMQRLIRALQRVTILLLSRACLYPPPPRQPGFSLACVPVLCDDLLMYRAGRIVMCRTQDSDNALDVLRRLLGHLGRGYAEFRHYGVLRSSP